MGNFEKKGKSQDSEFHEMEDLSEFKAALRVLRAAMALVHPWNLSVVALESFFIQSSFCESDLSPFEKQAAILTKFCDYTLHKNACR